MENINKFGLAGMIVSILGLFMSLYGLIPVAGIVLSAIALKQHKEDPTYTCKGFAIAGLVCGIICAVYAFYAFYCLIIFSFLASASTAIL